MKYDHRVIKTSKVCTYGWKRLAVNIIIHSRS